MHLKPISRELRRKLYGGGRRSPDRRRRDDRRDERRDRDRDDRRDRRR